MKPPDDEKMLDGSVIVIAPGSGTGLLSIELANGSILVDPEVIAEFCVLLMLEREGNSTTKSVDENGNPVSIKEEYKTINYYSKRE